MANCAQRLHTFRAELDRLGLDGFIVPRSDEHQGEYVAPSSERLAWLTGFTGSAGLAVILKDKAAVFIDGRYTLQAQSEVSEDLFEHCHLSDRPASAWIADNLAQGAALGFDPWLLTTAQVERYERATAKAGARLSPVDANPVDAVWLDQPARPASSAIAHDIEFAGVTSADKRRQLSGWLTDNHLDAVVLTAPDSIAWLLNIRGNDVAYSPLALSFAMLYADGSANLFIDGAKLSPETTHHLGKQVRCREPDAFGPALDTLGNDKKTVRLDPDTAAAWVAGRLELSGATIDKGVDPCQLAKARKNPVELDGIRAAHRRDGAALTRFLAWLAAEDQLSEMAASDKLEEFRRDNEHFRGLSFPTISGSGANGAIVHYRVTAETDKALEAGSLYLVDSGAQYLDGTTDVTRTVAIGKPTPEMRRNFTLVLKGHIALATARFPEGTSGSQLDVLARRPLWAEGLDYDHGTGHGVGCYLGVHEGPQRISKIPNRVALEPGMVISNEPGYYKQGAYGIRIENLVVVINTDKAVLGFETLTLAPIDRALIDKDLLNEEESAWVNAYHQRVLGEIGPLLDDAAKAWLKQSTAPL
ncbi:MAG: aminopeptidase P family protein [Proteobacteria bacterium]|nr:aminopeptidase P family protein [Pseudomonadota bacterium]MDA1022522.1 aminopeptidase P family protein [Pseudomonadota bacterium]